MQGPRLRPPSPGRVTETAQAGGGARCPGGRAADGADPNGRPSGTGTTGWPGAGRGLELCVGSKETGLDELQD